MVAESHAGQPADAETPSRRQLGILLACFDDRKAAGKARHPLEEKLRSATVIYQSDLGTDQVRVVSVVHVKDDGGKSTKYTIVGSAEASPAEAKLSNESPVGKALLGRKRGDEVVISTPRGERRLKITKIDVESK